MPADYDSLIDAETWAFIRKTEAAYPEDTSSLDVEGQRRIYDAMAAEFRQPRPKGVEVEDLSADGVPVRLYTAGEPGSTVMYFHGGGFVVGGLDSHDDVCAEICANTGYRVISVDYRLARNTPIQPLSKTPGRRRPGPTDSSTARWYWWATARGATLPPRWRITRGCG